MSQRVLIVDDEPPARERLRRLLGELSGVEVAGEAANGEQAVRLAGELRPDVVLLDVRMPGMNGLEAARHLALFETPPAVVFTTAYDAYAVEAFEAQAIGYLLKPVRAEKLAAALRRAARLGGPQLTRVAAGDPQRTARTHVAARLGDSVRLIAVPADPDRYGARHQAVTVATPLMVEAACPRFAGRQKYLSNALSDTRISSLTSRKITSSEKTTRHTRIPDRRPPSSIIRIVSSTRLCVRPISASEKNTSRLPRMPERASWMIIPPP